MNVLFHTVAAFGVITLVSKPNENVNSLFSKTSVREGFISFGVGVISHGVLDVIPHCYPINSKLDAIVSLLIMCLIFFFVRRKNKLLVGMAFLGSVFPDLIDLAPHIANSYLGFSFPEFDKLFPWHWHQYSGSIYSQECNLSLIYQVILVVFIGMILFFNKRKLIRLF